MKRIGFQDLRYRREKDYFDEILPKVADLRERYPEINQKEIKRAKAFFDLLSSSIRVDTHLMIKSIITIVERELEPDIPLKIFVYDSSKPRAKCTSYSVATGKKIDEELIILVSQHFFNILDFQERVAIIGHEVAHYKFGHLQIPTGVLLRQDFDLEDIYDFKVNLLKWSICAEISADLKALYLGKLKPKILSNAMIKYSSSITHLDSFDLIELLLDQYEDIANDVQTSSLALHPILPLRIKIIQEITKTRLVKNMGKEVSNKNYKKYIKEFEECIDNIVLKVYPEVISTDILIDSDVVIDMGLAVALADGKIDPAEIKTIENMTGKKLDLPSHGLSKEPPHVEKDLKSTIDKLINKSLKTCREQKYDRHDLSPLVRYLLVISSSDHHIDLSELRVIYNFAKEFGFSRYDISIILEQMHLN